MDRKRRLQIQLYYVIALTCRRRVSLMVRRVFSSGLEPLKQLCTVFEPWVSSRFQCPCPIAVNENRQFGAGKSAAISGYQVSERQKTSSWQCSQRYLWNGELAHQPDLQSGSSTTMCNLVCDEKTELIKAGQTRAVSGVVERTDLSPRGRGEGGKMSQDRGKGVKTAKPKECFCCVTSSHEQE